ncbi:cell division protein FtsK [Pseudonocardia sp. NPDC049635]|uniref:cell division protein FtsK n=1 Tax=Pseudonocardia sp. NPDC049635 TaxID=3155506 RepID=UPI0033C2DFDC
MTTSTAAAAPDPGPDRDPDRSEVEPVPVDPPAERRTIFATITGTREHDRRPIVPAALRNKEERADLVRWVARFGAHVTAFHAVRAPWYAAKLLAYSPRGLYRIARSVFYVVSDAEGAPLRRTAVVRGDDAAYLRLVRERNKRVARRGTEAAIGVAGLAVLVWLIAVAAGPAWQVLAAATAIAGLGRVGRPADRRVVAPATIAPSAPPRLTSDVVDRALRTCGVPALAKADRPISYVAPITRDGPGWRAEGDLPFGVTALDLLERRSGLSSGLRRPLGCVWPEQVPDAHDGRLVLWVGDQDMARARQAPWPLLKAGGASLFEPIPFGTDQRGRKVAFSLMYANVLIGAMPGAGKTFAIKPLLLAGCLDVSARLRVFELKGTGDLRFAENVAHDYGQGPDDVTVERCVASLRELHKELERRAAVIADLPRNLCPENKVTPELARQRRLGLFPELMVVDECQELFSHPEHGKEAGALATAIIKRGRALGVILVLATQRPDKDSLPTGVSANVGIRYCLRVMGQTENDMILGTSMYKNGVRASTLTSKDKGIGYLVGTSDEARVVRSYYLDGPTSDKVAERALQLRIAAGTITGQAAGEERTTVLVDLLEDLATIYATAKVRRMWSEDIVAALAELRPDTYTGWTPETLARALPAGVETRQIAGEDANGHRRNRRGLYLDDVQNVLERRARGEIEGGPA